MSLNRGLRGSAPRGDGGPPAWLVLLVVVALFLGGFYLLQGAQNFLRTGGLGVQEATARAQIASTATAARVTRRATQLATNFPTATPIPECVDFRVTVPNAIVRNAPTTNGAIVTSFTSGTLICVLGRAPQAPDWYVIDEDPSTRRRELAYMNETVIDAVNPTLTPSRTPLPSATPTPLPSVTPLPFTLTPTITPTPVLDSRATLPAPFGQPTATLTPSPPPIATVGGDSLPPAAASTEDLLTPP